MTTNGRRHHRPTFPSPRTNTANAVRPPRLFGTSSVSGNVLIFALCAPTGNPVVGAATPSISPKRHAMADEAECRLWRAVIAQAIEDATAPLSENPRTRKEKLQAREWFIEAGKDFHHACALAGYDPDRIRDATMKLIEVVKPRDHKPRRQQPRLQKSSLYSHAGRSMTIQEWSAETGLNKHVFYTGLKRGKCIGEIINGRGRVANFSESLPDRTHPSTQDRM